MGGYWGGMGVWGYEVGAGGGYGGGMGVQSTRWRGCYVFWVFFDYCDCVLVILYYYLIDSNYEQRRSCMCLALLTLLTDRQRIVCLFISWKVVLGI